MNGLIESTANIKKKSNGSNGLKAKLKGEVCGRGLSIAELRAHWKARAARLQAAADSLAEPFDPTSVNPGEKLAALVAEFGRTTILEAFEAELRAERDKQHAIHNDKRHQRLVELLVMERKSRKIRQHDLARKLRRHQSWVARLEGGQRRIDVVEFLELADVIGFNPAKMLKQVRAVAEATLTPKEVA
jgi:hypothetical protein